MKQNSQIEQAIALTSQKDDIMNSFNASVWAFGEKNRAQNRQGIQHNEASIEALQTEIDNAESARDELLAIGEGLWETYDSIVEMGSSKIDNVSSTLSTYESRLNAFKEAITLTGQAFEQTAVLEKIDKTLSEISKNNLQVAQENLDFLKKQREEAEHRYKLALGYGMSETKIEEYKQKLDDATLAEEEAMNSYLEAYTAVLNQITEQYKNSITYIFQELNLQLEESLNWFDKINQKYNKTTINY